MSRAAYSPILSTLVALVIVAFPSFAQEPDPEIDPLPKDAPAVPGLVAVKLNDESVLKVQLKEEKIELQTPFGKLQIPSKEITKIDFGRRTSEAQEREIATAIAELSSSDARKRQAATTILIGLKDKSHAAVKQAAKSANPETARRATQLLERLQETVSEEVLEQPAFDVIHTSNSKIAGQIAAATFRVQTLSFGEQPLKLADVRSLSTSAHNDAGSSGAVLPDPGTLRMYIDKVGKTFQFRVTAPVPRGRGINGFGGGVYGTGVYTTDSTLSMAAVHAGVLRPGQTGVVRVTMMGQQPGFMASFQNGVVSDDYGPWEGYRIDAPRNQRNDNPLPPPNVQVNPPLPPLGGLPPLPPFGKQ